MNRDAALGCLVLVFILLVVGVGCGTYFAAQDDDECTSTGEPGSAQYERDLQRAIEGDC